MLPGEVVADRFELERLAKAGGMGAVWRARDRLTGEIVAVKLLRDPDSGAQDDRFLREAALLAELRHPAIVRHIAHGRTREGDLFLAMEWLDGEDLAQRLVRGPLPVGEAIALARRIADGLAQLHARGGLHRDLKPANLFLEGGRPERAKLLDFGIARAAAALSLTHTGTILGTPGYTAPEHFTSPPDEIDARADVFALGVVLRELLVGARLGEAGAGGMFDAALRALHAENPPPSAQLAALDAPRLVARRRATSVARLRRRLRGALDRIAQRATASARDVRHASAAALAAELERDVRRHDVWLRSLRTLLVAGAAAVAGFVCGRA